LATFYIRNDGSLYLVFYFLYPSKVPTKVPKIYLSQHGDVSKLKYVAKWYPWGSIFAAVICAICIIGTVLDPASRLSVLLGEPAFVLLWVGYKIKYKTKFVRVSK